MNQAQYQPQIDGIRALAVLLVVYFHAFPEKLPSGYVGVDIFFVISGYLITGLLCRDIAKSTLNFREFYFKRIKRIFPALLTILISVTVFGWFFLLFDEYKQLGKHVLGGATFSSNFILWFESGYFDNASEIKPLLHLWSLGVEEQFYILWPVFIWVAQKLKINLFKATFILATLSFFCNVICIFNDQIATYYLPITRAWEFLAGALLAIHSLSNREVHEELLLDNLRSFLGLVLIVFSLVYLKRDSLFPGWWALMPVMGAYLLLSASSGTFINRYLFSNKLVVYVGLISYPLYLWHWPILSFLRISEARIPSANLRYKAIGASIILAFLTYRVIERPIRYGAKELRDQFKAFILMFLLLAVGSLGLLIYSGNGQFLGNEEPALNLYKGDINHVEFNRYMFNNFPECLPLDIRLAAPVWEGKHRCLQSKINGEIELALIGNSHAEHLFIGIAESFPKKNIAYYARDGMPTIANPQMKDVFDFVQKNNHIKNIIISIDWVGVRDLSKLEAELADTLKVLINNDKQVFLTDGVPTFPFDPVRCKAIRFPHKKELCDFQRLRLPYEDMLDRVLQGQPRVKMIRTMRYFCDSSTCSMGLGNEIFYRDDNHLNILGSKYVGQRIYKDYLRLFE